MARKKPRPYGTGAKVIELKSGAFAMRWCEFVIGVDGKKKPEWGYTNLGLISRKEAGDRLADKMASIRHAGPRREAVIPTFSELVDRYERDILAMKRLSTRVGRKTILTYHLRPRFGSKSIADITIADTQRFFTELREAGFQKTAERRENYSAHTLHDIRNVLRAVMKYANKWYRQPVDPITGLPFNPSVGIDLPTLEPKYEEWALTEKQAAALISTLTGKSKVMVALAIFTGMRRGELLALPVDSLFVESATEGIRQGVIHVYRTSYHGQVGPPKTKKGIRDIYLKPYLHALLEDWTRSFGKWQPQDLVFGTKTNRIDNPNNILRRHVFPACDRLEIPHATWLTFRRTWATWADNEHVAARTIADIMGHEKVGTRFIYTQSSKEMKRVAADRIGNECLQILKNLENEPALVN